MRAILFAAFALAACAQSGGETTAPQPQSELAQLIRADITTVDAELSAPGVEVAELRGVARLGDGLNIRPLEVIEDSRCALNVTCVWAGRLRVRVIASGIEGEHEMTLGGEPLVTPLGSIRLVVVSPSPWVDWPTDELGPRPPYRFGFRRG